MNKGNTQYKILQPLILSSCIAVGMMFGYKMNSIPESSLVSLHQSKDTEPFGVGRIEEVIRFIENKYVDSIDRNKLVEEALESIFLKLDPHSIYLTAEENQVTAEQMNGSYAGIGIEYLWIDDTLMITDLINDGPAQLSGLKSFDRIIKIDETTIAGKKVDVLDVRRLLRKNTGEKISITYLRNKEIKTTSFNVSNITTQSVEATYFKEIQTVYVKIERFGSKTYREFMEKIEPYFENDKKNHLILDMRGNPGGYMPEAINILCQIFKEKDQLLVYTKGKNQKRNDYKTTGKRFFNIDKVAVIIDEESASASEIVAGAIQDWDRGTIIGRRSYGKGLVQEQFELNNGGALRLTTARYFTPSGRSIQRDYANREDYDYDYEDRYNHGDFFEQDSSIVKNSEMFYTKNLKRKITSGGGISPDEFISLDAYFKSKVVYELSGEIKNFAYKYLATNKEEISNIIVKQTNWTITNDVFLDFLQVVNKDTELDLGQVKKEKTNLVAAISAEIKSIANRLQNSKNNYDDDPFVSAAIKSIKSENKF